MGRHWGKVKGKKIKHRADIHTHTLRNCTAPVHTITNEYLYTGSYSHLHAQTHTHKRDQKTCLINQRCKSAYPELERTIVKVQARKGHPLMNL